MSDALHDAPPADAMTKFVLQARALVPAHTTLHCRARTDHDALKRFEQARRTGDLRWFLSESNDPAHGQDLTPVPVEEIVSIARVTPTAFTEGLGSKSITRIMSYDELAAEDERADLPFHVHAIGFAVATQTLWIDAVDLDVAKRVGTTFAGMKAQPWVVGGNTCIRHIPRSDVLSMDPVA